MSATKANPANGASSDSPLKEKKKKGIVLPPVDHGYAWVIVTGTVRTSLLAKQYSYR